MSKNSAKKKAIKKITTEILKDCFKHMLPKIDKALDSGCIDIESWDAKDSPMIIPKCIVRAILINESFQYEGKGTGREKQLKKEVNNILNFI